MAIKQNPLANPKVFYKQLAYVSKILYPFYPCYFFPAFLLIQTYNKLVLLKKNPKYRVIALPNRFYNVLVKNQPFQCDHFCFISDELFDKFKFGDDDSDDDDSLQRNLNWLNVEFGSGGVGISVTEVGSDKNNKRSPDIVQTILSKPSSSMLVPVIAVQRSQKNCIFVSENCYHNWAIKNKVRDTQPLLVQLQQFNFQQYLPKLAARATIFLVNNPYELPFDVTDEIITNYFARPHVLYRNHTYEIPLNEEQVGVRLYAEFFSTFVALRKLYFRCVHLESKDSEFENYAVVVKGATTLHQSTSINYPIPRQYLDDYAFIGACPWGLLRHFNYLRKCITPFVGVNFYDSSTAASPSARASPSTSTAGAAISPNVCARRTLLAHRIFPAFLVQGARGSGKRRLISYVARSMGFQQYFVDCTEITSSSVPAQTETKLKLVMAKASICEPLIFTLTNFELFGLDNEGREDLRMLTLFQKELHELMIKERSYPIILVAIANGTISKPMIQSQFLETITIEAPEKDERFNHLQWIFHQEIFMQEIFNGARDEDDDDDYTDIPLWNGRTMQAAKFHLPRHLKYAKKALDILESVAAQTQGFQFGDLKLLFDNSTEHLLKCRKPCSIFQNEDCCLLADVFDKNLHDMQRQFTDSLGAPKVPRVLWSDIGGLSKLKEEIQSSIGLPLKHVHLMGKNMRRSGILLYGPPGTGKTLVAKAVATECSLSFLAVQGPELLNMYVGQSEQNVREIFVRARAAAPCVIFLDELDSLAPNRGVAGDSGGVMDRVVSQLLAEMDGIVTDTDDVHKQIFILAATNRPDLIDPALLRPGRFDKLLYVGPYITKEDKMAVLTAQMKNFHLAEGLTISKIADLLVHDMTGADIYSICSNAWLSAVRHVVNKHSKHKKKHSFSGELREDHSLSASDVIVELNDFRKAISKFVPTINPKDMAYFNNLRSTYSADKRRGSIK